MKEAISMPEKDRPLEIKGQDKVNVQGVAIATALPDYNEKALI